MSTKTNLILDTTIFIVFLVAFEPGLTGIAIHEWLSLAFTAAIITHLLFHWKWILTIGGQFFKKLFHESRLNFLVDTLFFIAMTTAIFTGIMISRSVLPFLGLQTVEFGPWGSLHTLSTDLALITLGLHFALHWQWIVNAVKRYLLAPVLKLFQRAPQPAPTSNLTVSPAKMEND
jgi:hypothetical protein